ncbi:MAG: hypothetical protein MMC33_010668 [Icmadophila ericetorum]|nr:hypothetical protein [Icmadophila ericetorum]
MVQRLAKGVLPANTQIQKDAITAMSKAATVFVNYLSHHANQNTLADNRKTISPQDVIRALQDTEYAAFAPRITQELDRYNQIQTAKRNEYRTKKKDGPAATSPSSAKKGTVDGEVGAEASGATANGEQEKGEVDKQLEAEMMMMEAGSSADINGADAEVLSRERAKKRARLENGHAAGETSVASPAGNDTSLAHNDTTTIEEEEDDESQEEEDAAEDQAEDEEEEEGGGEDEDGDEEEDEDEQEGEEEDGDEGGGSNAEVEDEEEGSEEEDSD